LSVVSDDDPEVKQCKQANLIQAAEEDILTKMFKRFSSWERLRVAVAWLLRYKNFLVKAYRLRHRKVNNANAERSGAVTVQELKDAEMEIIKYVQRQSFPREITSLKECKPSRSKCGVLVSGKKTVERTSPTFKLNPLLLDDVLCVGGRLENASIPERSKHPPILPKENHVCELIVRHYHLMYGHAGKEHVLSLIRRDFWIIRARVMVKRLIGQCFDCRRRNAPPCEQVMADLPPDRLIPDKPPFSYVGVDYFGPLEVKRARSMVKRYGCIFSCLTTRAVHIEIAHSLDTCSFIDALHRFINRRGKPILIRSDNGTNFKGGERELRESIQEWNHQAIHKLLRQRNIDWIFNPPSASNMGGVWERLIRSVRQILRALLKEQTVDDETLLTVMTHVEAILNSRPLTPCSDDSKDENPLTPNQILLLRDETCLPPGVFTKNDMYCRRRWRHAQYLADQFWKLWLREYLPQLQERTKWNRPRRNIAVGDIVLVVDKNVWRGTWPLARVLEVYQAKDGYVRSVKIKTKSSILTRPVNKLCLLERTLGA
jgi:transposase InsO family protein